jgi:flagellar biosynthetic protein FliR
MRVDVPWTHVWGFAAVFARVGGMVAFLPLPGLKTPIDPPRILLAFLITLALFPQWPAIAAAPELGPGGMAAVALREAMLGLFCGLLVSLVVEVFQVSAQLIAQQAGFSYASTIDPNNNTDSGVLLVLCQLLAGMLAIGAGLDRHLIRLFARSLDQIPPGSFSASLAHFDTAMKLCSRSFEMGLLLALPSIAIFVVLDVLLAVLSRLEQQLQLTAILFPVKTACAILVATISLRGFPGAFESMLGEMLGALGRVLAE